MSARATAHPWLVVAARFRLEQVLSDELPAEAARVVALGASVPALEELACLRPEYTEEARALLLDSLRELGIEPPNQVDAVRVVAREIAADIVAGHTSPSLGALKIAQACRCIPLDVVPELHTFLYADSEWASLDEDEERNLAFTQGVLEAARDLLEG